jgi:UDP-N-acetyl-D-galactosamine dehydrogenase
MAARIRFHPVHGICLSVPVAAAETPRFAVIGLGYVGLPLAVAFGRHWPTLGFDIDAGRIAELRGGRTTLEMEADELASATHLQYGSDPALLDAMQRLHRHRADADRCIRAARSGAPAFGDAADRQHLRAGDLVIYESTVYPGTTEEVCVPLLEQGSGLRFNEDFYCGYSPEQVSPGDRQRPGRHPQDHVWFDPGSRCGDRWLYSHHRRRHVPAPSMRVAEAAKVVENIQRDVNIALVNELALIFDRLGIDTQDVLDAAGSKWNFLPFRPGLVGGHCIGVDPYYLLHKSESVGYHPDLIHTARQVNNRVGEHVAARVLAMLAERGRAPAEARILVLGVTFRRIARTCATAARWSWRSACAMPVRRWR